MKARVRRQRQLDLLSDAEARADKIPTAQAREDILANVGSMSRRLRTLFRTMELVEKEIESRWPAHAVRPSAPAEERRAAARATSPAFRLCRPTEPVRVSELLVVAHTRELLSRFPDQDAHVDVRSGAVWLSLGQLTRAEVIGLLLEASLRHPLSHREACLYEMLFVDLFPGAPLGETLLHGAGREKLAEIRREADEWLSRESPERAPAVREMRRAMERGGRESWLDFVST